MELGIQIIKTEIKTVPTAKGSYQVNDLAYKDLNSGKVAGKKIMSFGHTADVFKTLATAQSDEVYTINQEKLPGKDGQEYWTWLSAIKLDDIAKSVAETKTQTIATTVKSNYETPEERAKKQVFIVRQNCVTNAVNTLSVGSKSVNPEQVIEVAEKYYNYVINGVDVKRDGVKELQVMEDDVPF